MATSVSHVGWYLQHNRSIEDAGFPTHPSLISTHFPRTVLSIVAGWVLRHHWPIYGEDDEVCFTYSASGGRQHIDTLLKDFAGTLVTDGYAVYERFAVNRPEVIHAQCWAHTRRAFEGAEQSEPEAVSEVLDIIGTLYQHEAEIRKRKLEGRAKQGYRARYSLPVVEAFFGWLHEQRNQPGPDDERSVLKGAGLRN